VARAIGRLTALKVDRLKESGMYSDGGGLYLQVTGDGEKHVCKSWIFQFKVHGRERQMGLGPLHTISLAEAREKATNCRKQRLEGIDPIDARRAARDQARIESAKAITFKACAEAYIEAHKAGWRNAKHGDQWRNTLATYAYPEVGNTAVQAIDVTLVIKILEPIWQTKTETASRVRGRIESVLDWATARGYRRGENPARWRGHLENLLPKRAKVQKIRHHPALPYREIGAFMAALRAQEGIAALALEFTILTAARTSETREAEPGEFSSDVTVWTVPDGRIKGGKEHRVPLSAEARAIARKMLKSHQGKFLFPGGKRGKPLSNGGMSAVLDRMGCDHITVHGFRSTFRDWAAERTTFPNEVVEMALAHVIENKAEAAYRRGDLLERRRPLMEAWAKYCSKSASVTSDKVVAIGTGKRTEG